MKVVVISDTHNKHKELSIPKCDILIHAGDATSLGREHEVRNFAKWFEKQPARHKFFVPGNHELNFEKHLPLSKTWFEEACPSGKLLIHEGIEVEGVKMFFSPYTPTFYNWAFMRDRGRHIGKKWDDIPNGLDILITHGPPYGILDVSIYDKVHCGCEELLKEVYAKKPRHHAYGHIHFYGGQTHSENGTEFHNASVCDEGYEPTNKIIEFEV